MRVTGTEYEKDKISFLAGHDWNKSTSNEKLMARIAEIDRILGEEGA